MAEEFVEKNRQFVYFFKQIILNNDSVLKKPFTFAAVKIRC